MTSPCSSAVSSVRHMYSPYYGLQRELSFIRRGLVWVLSAEPSRRAIAILAKFNYLVYYHNKGWKLLSRLRSFDWTGSDLLLYLIKSVSIRPCSATISALPGWYGPTKSNVERMEVFWGRQVILPKDISSLDKQFWQIWSFASHCNQIQK